MANAENAQRPNLDCWFIDRIRDVKKFDGVDELKTQLALDAVVVRERLG
ncbi:MAG: hypothetical protein KBF93_18895 [Leptospiraceae bacterium]|nr:hypothetical protein [Leptospiraceae bacterium]